MSSPGRDRQPEAAGAGQGAEGLVLVRLGQQRLRDHDRRRSSSGRTSSRLAENAAVPTTGSASSGCWWLRGLRSSSSPPRRSCRRSLLPLVGAMADRTARKKGCSPASRGPARRSPACCSSSPATTGSSAPSRFILGNFCFGASVVVNDSILPLIADDDERDRVSSRGWAFGYPGGGLLLAAQLRAGHASTTPSASSEGMAVRSACSRRRSGGRSSPSSPSAASTPRAPSRRPEQGGAAAAELRPAVPDAPRAAQLPLTLLPGGLPVLQRRHPDRDRLGIGLRREELGFETGPDRDDPDRAVRRVRRRADLRPARRRTAPTDILGGLVIWMVIVPSASSCPKGNSSRSCSSPPRSGSSWAAPRRSPAPSSAS